MMERMNGWMESQGDPLGVIHEHTAIPAQTGISLAKRQTLDVRTEQPNDWAENLSNNQLSIVHEFIAATTQLTRQQIYLAEQAMHSFISPKYLAQHEKYISDSINENVEIVSAILRELKISARQNVWVSDPATQRKAPVYSFGFNREIGSYIAKPDPHSSWPMVNGIHLFLGP
jgi:hypothetical protein